MTMMQPERFDTIVLEGEEALPLERFALACDTDISVVLVLVDEGLLEAEFFETNLRFDGHALARARTILRLQEDFGANLESVAVMIGLLDEIERLRARLHRAGIVGA
jgi:chaperone modulatory protein CbpM